MLSTTPKKGKKVVFLSSMHSANSMHSENRMHEAKAKEEINIYHNETKSGIDTHNQEIFLFTTARKQTAGQCEFFTVGDNSLQ